MGNSIDYLDPNNCMVLFFRCLADKGFLLCASPDLTIHALGLSDSSLKTFKVAQPVRQPFIVDEIRALPSPYPSAVVASAQGGEVAFVLQANNLLSQEGDCVSYAVKRTNSDPVLLCARQNNHVSSF